MPSPNGAVVFPIDRIVRGYNAMLYSAGKPVAHVNEWTAQITPGNTDYQAGGSALVQAPMVSYQQSLRLVETMVSDLFMMDAFLNALAVPRQAFFQLLMVVEPHRAGSHARGARVLFKSCSPDGAIDLYDVRPGDILRRNWSFRVNEPVEPQQLLTFGDNDTHRILLNDSLTGN